MKLRILASLSALTLAILPTAAKAAETPVMDTNITLADVETIQKAWGAALIQISKDYKDGGIEKPRPPQVPFSMLPTATTWARCSSSPP